MGIFGKRDPFKNIFERTNGKFHHFQIGDTHALQVAGIFSESSHMCNVYVIDKKLLSKNFTIFLNSAISKYESDHPGKKESHPIGEKVEIKNYPLDYFDFKVTQREIDSNQGSIKDKNKISQKQFHVTVLFSASDLSQLYFLPSKSSFQSAINLKLKVNSELEFALWNLVSSDPTVYTAIKLRVEFEKGKPGFEKIKLVLPYSPSMAEYGLYLQNLGLR